MNLTILFELLNLLATQTEQKLFELIAKAHSQADYQTILIAGATKNLIVDQDELLKRLQGLYIPMIQLDDDLENKVSTKFNRKLLNLVYLVEPEEAAIKRQLQYLWPKLERMTQSPTILLFGYGADETLVEPILAYCIENKAMYTIAITMESLEDNYFYANKMFPKPIVIKQHISSDAFPEHVSDMYGQPLRVICGRVIPRTFYYNDTQGRTVISGIFGLIVRNYAAKHNATLTFPTLRTHPQALFINVVDACIQNQSHDLAAEYGTLQKKPNISVTNFMDFYDTCLMVPVRPVPGYLYYFVVYDIWTVALICLTYILIAGVLKILKISINHQNQRAYQLDIDTLNGLLGQCFRMERQFVGRRSFIYLIICFTGITFNATFSSHLSSYNAHPPTEPLLMSKAEIKTRGLSMLVFEELYRLVTKRKLFDFTGIPLTFKKDYADYTRATESFDMRYVFMALTAGYSVFEEQQQFFSKPVLRFTDICWRKNGQVFLPLQSNSLYLPTLNTFIGQMLQAGLLQHWKKRAILELMRYKVIKIVDLSRRNLFVPAKLEDLSLVLIILLGAWCFAIICFLIEICVFKRKQV